MNRDWTDFKSLYGNIAGAREQFENACESIFREIHTSKNVKPVKVSQGDGGVDIFVGEMGVNPIIVIQCKFFLEEFGDAQKKQITDSFKTAIEATIYELESWELCIPRELTKEQHSWWSKWKSKVTKEHNKTDDFIALRNGNTLIDLMKKYDIYNTIFKIEDSILAKDTNEKLTKFIASDYGRIENDDEDLGIIGEIFDYVQDNKPEKLATIEEIIESGGITLKNKIILNFPKEQQQDVNKLVMKVWDKAQVVKKFIEAKTLEDEISIKELIYEITEDFCTRRETKESNARIEDIKIIFDMALGYIPDNKKKNIGYVANGQALILYFFELCYFGDTDDEFLINPQISLF